MRYPDDRGREVTILWPSSAPAVAAEKEYPELAGIWDELRRWARARRPWEIHGRRITLGCGPAMILYLGVAWWFIRAPHGLFLVGVAFVLTGFSFWAMRRSGLMRAGELVRGMVSLGHCPSCAYGIGEAAPEQDGCVVCPECGSAWRTSASTAPRLNDERA